MTRQTTPPNRPIYRRELQRSELRRSLVDAAIELAVEQGFEATTVEQIAERVGVSARTFHRHFASKDDVLFADNVAARELFAATLASRPRGEDLFASMREAAATFSVDLHQSKHEIERTKVIESNERLVGLNLRHAEDWCGVAAEFAAGRMDLRADDLVPQLFGRCAVVAMTLARRRCRDTTSAEVADEIRSSFAVLANFSAAATNPTPQTIDRSY